MLPTRTDQAGHEAARLSDATAGRAMNKELFMHTVNHPPDRGKSVRRTGYRGSLAELVIVSVSASTTLAATAWLTIANSTEPVPITTAAAIVILWVVSAWALLGAATVIARWRYRR